MIPYFVELLKIYWKKFIVVQSVTFSPCLNLTFPDIQSTFLSCLAGMSNGEVNDRRGFHSNVKRREKAEAGVFVFKAHGFILIVRLKLQPRIQKGN